MEVTGFVVGTDSSSGRFGRVVHGLASAIDPDGVATAPASYASATGVLAKATLLPTAVHHAPSSRHDADDCVNLHRACCGVAVSREIAAIGQASAPPPSRHCHACFFSAGTRRRRSRSVSEIFFVRSIVWMLEGAMHRCRPPPLHAAVASLVVKDPRPYLTPRAYVAPAAEAMRLRCRNSPFALYSTRTAASGDVEVTHRCLRPSVAALSLALSSEAATGRPPPLCSSSRDAPVEVATHLCLGCRCRAVASSQASSVATDPRRLLEPQPRSSPAVRPGIRWRSRTREGPAARRRRRRPRPRLEVHLPHQQHRKVTPASPTRKQRNRQK